MTVGDAEDPRHSDIEAGWDAENPCPLEVKAGDAEGPRCLDAAAGRGAAQERVGLLDEASRQLLQELCEGGDFLTAERRASVVREVLAGTASDPACRRLFEETKQRRPSSGVFELVSQSACAFAEPAECHGLGRVVLAAANLQHLLDAEWYEAAAESTWRALDALGELPEAARAAGSRDEKAARLAEIINVTAATVGIRAWYRSMGMDLPALPPTGARPPRFACVADFCPSGYEWNPPTGWGPQVPNRAATQDVLASHGLARQKWVPTAPMSPIWKWEPAPGTSTQWFSWMGKMYPPFEDLMDVARSDWHHGSTITRLDMEFVAAAYTMNVGCSF